MLIDDIAISVLAGSGGKGAVAFNKILMTLGPAGGSGGSGGSVYLEGVADLSALNRFRFKKKIAAEDGEDGRPQFVDGKSGHDFVMPVPVGTVVHNLDTKETREIVSIGERLLVAKGGRGGKGNFHFRSSTNTSPREFQEGTPGEAFSYRLELKLIADVGFVGLPNVGKSSLLNELTRASVKVANYPFTTLEPNLGVWYDLILADIPGLIEGASGGKGLGVKFLRHIERTRILFHFVAADSVSPAADYATVRAELAAYNPALAKKDEYLVVSRSDEVTPENLKKIMTAMKKLNKNVLAISIYDDESIAKVREVLGKIAEAKRVVA